MSGMPLMGYPSRWSVRAGTAIDFMVSASVDSYRAEIVRVTGRGPRPDGDGPPLSCERVPSDVEGRYPGSGHQTVSGSYGVTGQMEPSPAGEGSIWAWVYPTLPAAARWQSILTWLGPDRRPALVLGVDEAGFLALRYGRGAGSDDPGALADLAGAVTSPQPLAERQWHYVAGSISPAAGRITLVLQASRGTHRGHDPGRPAVVIESEDELLAASPLGTGGLLAALGTGPLRPGVLTSVVDGSYNGKIDEPQALPHALTADGLLGRAGQPPGAAAVAGVST